MSLTVKDLIVELGGKRLLDGVSFEVPSGARVGLVGASGSGKSLTALAILGLLPPEAKVTGSITWNGRELLTLSEHELAALRGDELSIVFQEPRTALNPIRNVGKQISDPLRIHRHVSRQEAREAAIAGAAKVQLPEPEKIISRYPHQLSGGQRQRVAIAMALACEPDLLIADEPTTALDVTVQASVLKLLLDLVENDEMTLVFITHDLAVLSQVADYAVVLDKGRVIEQGTVKEVLSKPQNAITEALIRDATATIWQGGDA